MLTNKGKETPFQFEFSEDRCQFANLLYAVPNIVAFCPFQQYSVSSSDRDTGCFTTDFSFKNPSGEFTYSTVPQMRPIKSTPAILWVPLFAF